MKKYSWIIVALLLFILMLLFKFLATNKAPVVTNEKLSFDVVQKGDTSGLTTHKDYIVVNASQWELVWNMITDKQSPQPKRPEANFNNSIILVVAQGQKSTGGYTIEVGNVYAKNGIIQVVVDEKSPGKNCNTTQSITEPYAVIKLKKVDNPIQFLHQNNVINCK